MNAIGENDPELVNLLLILAEHPDEKENIIPGILNKLPWGCHPSLYIEKVKNPRDRILIRDTIQKSLTFEKIKHDLNILLAEKPPQDFLLKGAFILSFFSDSINHTYDEFIKEIDNVSAPLIEKINALTGPGEKSRINLFIRYFFKELNFNGNSENPYYIENHFINKVLDAKKGGSIVLCILANAVASRAGIELPVIITAGHFLLKTNLYNEIPFIDPFLNGKIISERDHMSSVAEKGYDPSIGLIHITSHLTLLQRLARNLMHTAQMSEYKDSFLFIKEIHEKIKIFIRNNPTL